jgi:Phage integrase, N-terminal SAM-like domain
MRPRSLPTRLHYAGLYDHHIRPYLGSIALREITPETIGRWQAERLAGGAGPVAVRHAMDLLGSVLEHAFVAGRIVENPARRVKKARRPRREEVQALSPATIEAMRAALDSRAAKLPVLA